MTHGPVTKFFKVGAYLDKHQVAILTSADTVMPLNVRYGTEVSLWLETDDTFLAGDIGAVDFAEKIQPGMKLRATTEQERELLAKKGIA